MLVCFDFGNTLLKYALFENDQLVEKGVLSKEKTVDDAKKLFQRYPNLDRSILSSVVDHDERLDSYLADGRLFHKLGSNTKINFSISSVKNPIEIGADRLALCAAVVAMVQEPSYKLIIGLGTCITYNFLTIDNDFLGGGISPGLSMRYHALHHHTYLLPLLSPEATRIAPPLVGYDTATNIHSGVLYGMAEEIDGMIGRYMQRYARLHIYITGGDMDYLLPHIKSKIFADPNLIMKGLQRIAYENL